jgi:hypothetical protein
LDGGHGQLKISSVTVGVSLRLSNSIERRF